MEQTNQMNVPNQNEKGVSMMNKSYDEQILNAMRNLTTLMNQEKPVIDAVKDLVSLMYKLS